MIYQKQNANACALVVKHDKDNICNNINNIPIYMCTYI